MKQVFALIEKEIQIKSAALVKHEAKKKNQRERHALLGGQGPDDDSKSEVDELAEKLQNLGLPEETKQICDREIKKLRQLGPRNQEYHVSLNYL